MLTEEERKDLINYRIEKSHKVYKEAIDNAMLGHWNLAGNRLYYSCFHMIQALLLDNGLDAHTHSGMIHVFGQHFITSGRIKKEYGRLISRLFELRQSGDYNDMFDATEEDVKIFFEPVKNLQNEIEQIIIHK
ncbi:MAG: HEPN domain-containing protein [Bacteroidaceae bacterium]|nr:HEPN domain-containing protein [Bacteroidaceae bacterium]